MVLVRRISDCLDRLGPLYQDAWHQRLIYGEVSRILTYTARPLPGYRRLTRQVAMSAEMLNGIWRQTQVRAFEWACVTLYSAWH